MTTMSAQPTPERAIPLGDRRRANRATGLLADANAAGVLHAADVHVAARLAQLAGEKDEEVALALALATRAVRTGSVAMDLRHATELDPAFPWPTDPQVWLAKVSASPLVARQILLVDDGLLYLERYHDQEMLVARVLRERREAPPPPVDEATLAAGLARLFPNAHDADQRTAADLAVRERTVVITGGPGTGKTTTVAKILALLAEQYAVRDGFHVPRFALAAPTAKAAARLAEAFHDASAALPKEDRDRLPQAKAATLHRLLGWRPDSRSRFAHNRGARLPHDVIVLDEASMVSLTMMARLLEALRPGTRLIVVGDPDQLTSVEAGAILADLAAGLDAQESNPRPAGEPAPQMGDPDPTPGIRPVLARLRRTYRFGEDIDQLAQAIRVGDADTALAVLRSDSAKTSLEADATGRRGLMVAAALTLRELALAADREGALAALTTHRLLCAHRSGPYGVSHWNRQIEQWVSEETGENVWAPMYPGRPLLVTTNDYAMDLFNGDTGVVLRSDGRLVAVFDSGTGIREIAASRLSDVETMHAATVHKSQGSQAHQVTVLLPEVDSPLLTRELIYTAVTRAQHQVTIIGTEDAFRQGLERRIHRASGLRRRLRT